MRAPSCQRSQGHPRRVPQPKLDNTPKSPISLREESTGFAVGCAISRRYLGQGPRDLTADRMTAVRHLPSPRATLPIRACAESLAKGGLVWSWGCSRERCVRIPADRSGYLRVKRAVELSSHRLFISLSPGSGTNRELFEVEIRAGFIYLLDPRFSCRVGRCQASGSRS